ncbi:MAG: hypothetical protein ACREMQ_07510, partial [Longimicrobiales bacterium]
MTFSSPSRFLPLLLVLTTAGGCVSAGARRESRANAILIRVENAQFENVIVYVVRAEVPVRLGVVEGFQTRSFPLPAGSTLPCGRS